MDFSAMIFPEYDFLFLYDQSSGHTKICEDGFLVNKTNINYEGPVNTMHDSVIKEVGSFQSMLKSGDTQRIVYTKHDK